jgi:hypothetical protein
LNFLYIKEDVRLIHGELTLDSLPERGSRLVITIPQRRRAALRTTLGPIESKFIQLAYSLDSTPAAGRKNIVALGKAQEPLAEFMKCNLSLPTLAGSFVFLSVHGSWCSE